MHDSIGGVEDRRIECAPGWVPAAFVSRRGGASYQPDDVVPIGAQATYERRPDQSRRPRDDNLHRLIVECDKIRHSSGVERRISSHSTPMRSSRLAVDISVAAVVGSLVLSGSTPAV